MSLWQLSAALGGFARFNGAEEGLSQEAASEAADLLKAHASRTTH